MSKITSLSQLDPNGYYTYADYITWQFQERVELFKGMISKMSPAPNVKHQRITGNLYGIIWSELRRKKCQVFSAPFDVRLPVSHKKGKNDTVVQPDLIVLCNPAKLDEQGCNGAPDIVIEILSPGNSRKELKDKFELYEASHIPEYWIVDPVQRDVLIYSLDENQKYIGSRPYVSSDMLTTEIIPSLKIDLNEVFDNLDE